MSERQKVQYHEITAGYEFPPARFQIGAATVTTYLKAVEETSSLYQEIKLVPPTAVAAYAMASLAENLSFPAGAIHVSQELEFKDTVNITDTLVSQARVARKQDRGKLHLMTIDFTVFNQAQKEVLTGKTSFILPE